MLICRHSFSLRINYMLGLVPLVKTRLKSQVYIRFDEGLNLERRSTKVSQFRNSTGNS